jgi:hypothetical protein
MAFAAILEFRLSVTDGIFEHCQVVRCYGKNLNKVGP